ncbi:MAG: hypothetical protein ABI425_03830 [Patescibacteria group bacterium]
MVEKRILSSEHQSHKEILKTIQEVRQRPFSFGFREAFLNKKARIYTPNGGWNWRMKVQAPTLEGDWYGNCVQDAWLSASTLRNQLPESTSVIIQHLDAKSLGNSLWQQDHYKVLVEDQRFGVMEYVDHSPFHTIWLHAGNKDILEWTDITSDYESEVRGNHEPEVDGKLVVIAYCEFDIRETRGIAFVSLFHKERNGWFIAFDLIMPGLPVGDTDWRVYLDFDYGKIDKSKLMQKIRDDELIYSRSHPALAEYTDEKMITAKRDFPPEIKDSLQTWFEEMVGVLPEEIPDPYNK